MRRRFWFQHARFIVLLAPHAGLQRVFYCFCTSVESFKVKEVNCACDEQRGRARARARANERETESPWRAAKSCKCVRCVKASLGGNNLQKKERKKSPELRNARVFSRFLCWWFLNRNPHCVSRYLHLAIIHEAEHEAVQIIKQCVNHPFLNQQNHQRQVTAKQHTNKQQLLHYPEYYITQCLYIYLGIFLEYLFKMYSYISTIKNVYFCHLHYVFIFYNGKQILKIKQLKIINFIHIHNLRLFKIRMFELRLWLYIRLIWYLFWYVLSRLRSTWPSSWSSDTWWRSFWRRAATHGWWIRPETQRCTSPAGEDRYPVSPFWRKSTHNTCAAFCLSPTTAVRIFTPLTLFLL